MKISELSAFVVRIPLRKPIKHASHTRSETQNVVVRCVLDDGTIGHGEGVPRDYVTGETADTAIELLKRSDLPAQFERCDDFKKAVAMADRLKLAPVPGDTRGVGGNAARCAVELAILDAYGRAYGEPLTVVSKIVAPEIYEFHDWVRYSGAITSARGLKARFAAWRMWIYGFKQVKIKVGIEGYDDVARFNVIRGRIGKKTDLRVDANEAWSADEAVDRISELEPFRITSVEQPIPHADVTQLARIRKRVKTPIMLDESLCGFVDAKNSIDNGLCDLFNLRLSKCGGFIPSLRLALLAREAGLGYQLGCQIGETAILSAAGRNFACSVANIRYLEGSYDRHLVKEALGKQDITFGWGGCAPALNSIGLGIMIDPQALARVTERKDVLLG
ncbi:MAG: dipeptide epimerase [Planctomycetes bacterium]|nr:dipeptide epimerase [Planctomycetota bacterium]